MPETRICICMATFNPPPELFRRQIESIRSQSHPHWTCLIQDDASSPQSADIIRRTLDGDRRFALERNATILGFYGNFERVLARVPAEADLVSLADQDDSWHPHKLHVLAEALQSAAVTLAWANARVITASGDLLSPRFLPPARPHSFESQFFTNTVPGALALFRRSLLPSVLPFPPARGTAYHDWWIALVAMASGETRFVDDIVQDYVQHDANAVGWKHVGRPIAPARLLASAEHRRAILKTAKRVYEEDCRYLASAIDALCRRIPASRHQAAMQRLQRLLTQPRRTMLLQYLRALRSGAGSRRERNLLLAQLLGR